MTKQNPDLFLIKVGDGETPEVFSRLCGLRTRSVTLGGSAIDVTTIPCEEGGTTAWQENMHGLRTFAISGSGFFESKAQVVRLLASKTTGTGIVNMQAVAPGLGTFQGLMLIGDIGLGADIDGGGVTQDVSFTSAGAITFTPEV